MMNAPQQYLDELALSFCNVLKREDVPKKYFRLAAEFFKYMYEMNLEEISQLREEVKFLESIIVENKISDGLLKQTPNPLIMKRRQLIAEIYGLHREELAVNTIQRHKTSIAKKNALKSHKDDHEAKKMVFEWLDKNPLASKSLDGFADLITGKIVPMSWRTVRKWVGEWKKLRHASRA